MKTIILTIAVILGSVANASILSCADGEINKMATVTGALCEGTNKQIAFDDKTYCLDSRGMVLEEGIYQVCGKFDGPEFWVTKAQDGRFR